MNLLTENRTWKWLYSKIWVVIPLCVSYFTLASWGPPTLSTPLLCAPPPHLPESAARGLSLLGSNECLSCHSLDGSTRIGPSFVGLFGRSTLLSDGRNIEANEEYIRTSVLNPSADTVKGFSAGVMQSYRTALSDDDINSIISYFKAAQGISDPPVLSALYTSGENLFFRFGCNTCHSISERRGRGPTLRGILGRQQKLTDGRTVTIGRQYIADSLKHPEKDVLQGYVPFVPHLSRILDDSELESLVDYISSR